MLLWRAAAAPTAAAATAAFAAATSEAPLTELPPLPFPPLDAAEPHGALERLLQDGAVLLRSKLTFQEAKSLTDDLMSGLQLQRNPIEGRTGVSMNPWNDSNLVSPLRVAYGDNHQLAPADHTAQGPHQEGLAASRNNRKFLAFFCEEPSEQGGETAIFDMQRAWQLLPATLQEKLRRSDFGHIHAGGGVVSLVPAVVRHWHSDAPCLQFYCFGRTSRDCVDMYRAKTGRYNARVDPYSYKMSKDADMLLVSGDGERVPFVGLELYQMLSSIYDSMHAHRWQKGDILLVDNVRFAHARLEGLGQNRSIRFFHYGPADMSFTLAGLDRP